MPGDRVSGEQLAKRVHDTYSAGVATLLQRVARRLADGVDEPGWAERKLAETDELRREARDLVMELTDEGIDEAEQIVDEALRSGADASTSDLEAVGDEVRGELVRTDEDTVEAFARQAVGQLDDARPQILRSVEDGYRRAISETADQVAAGTATRREASARALERLASDGLGGFTDSAGRTWEIESYAEMATRTAAGRASVAGYMDTLERHGRDLVIVSASPEPCDLCDPLETLVLSIRGDTSGEAVMSTADAEAQGLHHPNCTHALELYLPGVTERPDRPRKEERRDRYDSRQRQREIERRVREWKRRAAVAEEIDDGEAQRARAKVRRWQAEARRHADAETGAARQVAREQTGAR